MSPLRGYEEGNLNRCYNIFTALRGSVYLQRSGNKNASASIIALFTKAFSDLTGFGEMLIKLCMLLLTCEVLPGSRLPTPDSRPNYELRTMNYELTHPALTLFCSSLAPPRSRFVSLNAFPNLHVKPRLTTRESLL